MRLTLGYSPCPNDTFIFDAMVHGRIDTEGLEFNVRLGDVEELNRLAFAGELDATKLSYHAFGHLTGTYALLNAGSALGRGVGPLLVTADRALAEGYLAGTQVQGEAVKEQGAVDAQRSLRDASRSGSGINSVAIPGKFTTANYLLGLAFPELANKQEVLFSDIEARVLSGEFTAGLLIHENRFTYHERGLHKLMDLGEFWEGNTGFAIPLGGIVIKRSLPPEVQRTFDRVLARSVQYAFDNPEASADYVATHAQEMDPEVRRKHIDLYVNDYSLDLGPEGRAAVNGFLAQGRERGVIPAGMEDIFVA
ncbi:menaquinone biosynthesis family protein [Neolewinella persica]|uniref:menaquinone biosynthesis family protein n=1 Tax=Neolewinella persica TaxID=70998 RepID=UPI0003801EC9|nr:1,4-dihydroxy-6-naphthoate synthase [Neolewinella persica]